MAGAVAVYCDPRDRCAAGDTTALLQQLDRGGRMVVPVGQAGKTQNLLQLEKNKASDEIVGRTVIPVRFVPMVSGDGAESAPE